MKTRLRRDWFGAAVMAVLLIMISGGWVHPNRASGEGFSSGRSSFTVKVRDEASWYRIMAVFVLPTEKLALEVAENDGDPVYDVQCGEGKVTACGDNKWEWEAPATAGMESSITITDCRSKESMELNIFVMTPAERMSGKYLNGYCIGRYPTTPLRNQPIYSPPTGFIEVTRENEETLVSPHFRLKQFVCKQNGGYPKYVVLQERLLIKLELILERMNERGFPCTTFHVMSGYRTPYYNKTIGNGKYSRHLWGGAADIFIDEDPQDEMMDDLNQDGTIDCRDADVLVAVIEELFQESEYESLKGGLGQYKKKRCRGPFVHVDVRGSRTRW